VDHGNETWRTRRSLVPGLLLSGIAVVALVVVAEPARAFEVLLTARPAELGLAVAVFVVGLSCRAACSRELVDGRGGFGGAFAALNIGYLANNLLPLRAGEVIRSVVLGRRSGLGIVGGATAVGAERLLDVVFAATILIAALPAIGVDTGWVSAATAAVAAATGIAVLIIIARHRAALAERIEPKLARWPRVAAQVPRIVTALGGLAQTRRLARAAAWLGLGWLLGITFFWLVMRSLIPGAPFVWAAFGIGVMAFGIALPSSPGAIGIYEAAWVGALALCGVDAAEALAFGVASHALTFTITSVCGLVALIRQVPGGEGVAGRTKRLIDDGDLAAPEEAGQ
jgi:uncharacterized protein (TIRG00374 family)